MQQQSLNGKVALITGSARRIGAVIAQYLHAAGMNIIVHYSRSHDEAKALVASLNQQRTDSATLWRCDLNTLANLQETAAHIHALFGRLDALVHNASQFTMTNIDQLDPTSYDQLLHVNLKIPFLLSQACAPYLKESKGSIVNITDVHGHCPLKHYGIYSISKAGLIMATKVLAKELAPDVRVNAISPGTVLWPEGENNLTAAKQQELIEKTLLKRGGQEADAIAKGALFFIRDACYSTGQVLTVDGGRLLTTT